MAANYAKIFRVGGLDAGFPQVTVVENKAQKQKRQMVPYKLLSVASQFFHLE